MRKPHLNGSVAAAAAITAALYLPTATAWAEDIVIKRVDGGNYLFVDAEASETEDEEIVFDATTVAPHENQYWIGVGLHPLSDVVRAQLDLPDGVGIAIDKVFPDSPAAEAGIEQHDIILSLGDQPVREPKQMAKIVAEAKDSELSLTILRKGKPVELTLMPGVRPGTDDFAARAPWVFDPTMHQKLEARYYDGDVREFRLVRPGIVLGHRNHEQQPLPEGMRLRIDREGGKPDRIVIDRGDDHWELTDKEQIKELPDDVRDHVERHLGRPHAARRFTFDAPLQRGLSWLQSQQGDGEESDDEDSGDQVWQELEEGGPLPKDFNLDRAMEQIESIREQFEQLADEQAERTEDLVEEKSEQLEKTLGDRVTRLEEMLTQRADQLREMIESFFGNRVDVEIDAADADGEDGDEEAEADEENEVEIELDVDSNSDAV